MSDTQAYKQFGSPVAVPVIHAIAQEILKVLDQNSMQIIDERNHELNL
ncbi:hypothetical protein [Mycoplasmopsis pullorum]|nr:hypothetical protein [Mycoplasmopsis pullorum]